MACFYTEDDRR